MNESTKRNELNGQYAHGFEVVCKCGHTKGTHTAAAPYSCLVGQMGDDAPYCECEKFKKGSGVQVNDAQPMIHKFEKAGLGKAPFRCVGSADVTFQACPGAPIQPGGSCDYCGTGITTQVYVRSADGKNFKVGIDYAAKIGDAGLKRAVNKIKVEANHKRDDARINAAKDRLADPELREKLSAQPHPHLTGNLTALDFVNWTFDHAGRKGMIEAARLIEKNS